MTGTSQQRSILRSNARQTRKKKPGYLGKRATFSLDVSVHPIPRKSPAELLSREERARIQQNKKDAIQRRQARKKRPSRRPLYSPRPVC